MTDFLQRTDIQIVFADHANDFNPAVANDLQQGTPTEVDLALASLGDTSARQSDKVDLGASRARRYSVSAAFELAATPTAGDIIELYWGPSPDSVAANGNPGGLSGTDAAYTGYSSNLADSLLQLQWIGSFVCTVQATGNVQIQTNIGEFAPTERYGILVVVNESGAAFHTDDVESHVVLTPIIDETGA